MFLQVAHPVGVKEDSLSSGVSDQERLGRLELPGGKALIQAFLELLLLGWTDSPGHSDGRLKFSGIVNNGQGPGGGELPGQDAQQVQQSPLKVQGPVQDRAHGQQGRSGLFGKGVFHMRQDCKGNAS